jgi:hypothetical protein
MPLSVNYVIQILGVILQVINQTSDTLPPKGKFWATVIMAVIQGVIGVLAHFSNPDGTPSSVPYVKGD